ncbi:MAG: P-II family nitrogen regulator [Tissierellia bacterium]|nr:P-II family nitrogen regulator [Tissierellia bacterium]
MLPIDVELIVVIIERGKADKIIKKAKEAGARGATVFYGRGTGESDIGHWIGRNIDQAKEVILILTETGEKEKKIMEAVVEAGKIREPGTGIAFTLPVKHLFGLAYREDFETWED